MSAGRTRLTVRSVAKSSSNDTTSAPRTGTSMPYSASISDATSSAICRIESGVAGISAPIYRTLAESLLAKPRERGAGVWIFNLGSGDTDVELDVAPIQRGQCGADDLDVLLRHRPRSISRGTTAFHAKH